MFLNYMLNIEWWNYNWVFKETTKSIVFKYFQKTEVYLEHSQTSKMKPFVKIINSLMLSTIFTKGSIIDVWLGSKNATKSFNKSFCELSFLALAAIWLNVFPITLYIFISSNIKKGSSSFAVQDFYFYWNEYLRKSIHKYVHFSLSPRQDNGVW